MSNEFEQPVEPMSRTEDLLRTGTEEPVIAMSRIEKILRGEKIKPQSRIEDLLLKYNPSDILIEKSITENGTYYARIDNADGYYKVVVDTPVIPPTVLEHLVETISTNGTHTFTPGTGVDGFSDASITVSVAPNVGSKNITENGTYNASSDSLDGYSSVVVDVDEIAPQNSYGVKQLTGLPADIATFNDGETLPLSNLKVGIEPVQDLHGYDAPWVGGAGKNKLQVTATTQTLNGVTFTVNSDGTVSLSGTATGTFVFPLISGTLSFTSDTIITGGYAEASASKVALRINGSNLVPSEGYTISANTNITEVAIRVNSGFNTNGVKLYPMIRLSSVTDATFAPYSNICPILGWNEVDMTRTGKNLSKSQTNNSVLCSAKKGVTYTVSFEGNVGANIKKNTNSGEVVIWGPQLPLTFTADEDFNIFLNAWNAKISNIQVEVGNQATAYEPYNGQTYTIDLDGTRYGGELDVVNGVLTVDRAYFKYIDVSTTSGTAVTDGWRCNFTCPIDDINRGKWSIQTGAIPIFNKISSVAKGYGANEYTVTLPNVTSKQEADAMLEGLEICYKLATPLTIQLSPTAVKSLEGINNLFADCGQAQELSYLVHVITNLETINITSNGDYTPQLTKGYSQVNVNLPDGTNTEY